MERYLVDILPDEGLHGRRVIATNEQKITADNVVKVLNTAIATHDKNRGEIQYLWDVYRGKQDIRKKEKIVREEINNKITVNIANEIVTFKTAFLLSGPVQYIGAKGSKTDNNKLVDLNRWMSDEDKQSKDKEIVDWMHIAGLGVRMVLPDPGAEQAGSPACIYTLDPREAFVIYYSGYTKKPMAGVLTQYDENDAKYYGVYTDSEYFEIKSGKITRQSGHLYGSVPIVEYPNNSARMGAFEVVLPLLNGINTLESNRVDNVQDFVNAYDVFQNVDLEDGQYSQLASGGKFIKIKDSQQGMPAKIYRISSEMNSSTVQTAVDDLHDKILTICGMPNRNGGSSTSDTGQATIMRDGWKDAESRAQDSEDMFRRSERQFLRVFLTICNTTNNLGLNVGDVYAQFTETAVAGKPCIVHRAGSGIVTLRGLTNQCKARFKISFGANIAIPTGGTVEAISASLAINGEPLNSATATVTPAAVENFFNIYIAAFVEVPRGCCVTIAAENSSTQAISISNSNLIVERES